MPVEMIPADSYFGVSSGMSQAYGDQGAQGVPAGAYNTADYTGRGKFCSGKNDTCKAYRVKGTDLCISHLREQENQRRLAGELPV